MTKAKPKTKTNAAPPIPPVPAKARLLKRLAYVSRIVHATAATAGRWRLEQTQADLNRAADALTEAAIAVQAIPDGWAPTRGRARAQLDIATVVVIRDSRKPLYADLLEEGADVRLEVLNLSSSMVRARTPAGRELYLPRPHVEAA